MSNAAHPMVIETGTDGDTFNEMDGIKSLKFGPNRTMLETTDFKDASGAKTRMAGLKDGTIEVSGDLEAEDANGQNVLRTAYDNGTDAWMRIKFAPAAAAGSQGYKVKGIVESYSIDGEVDGIVQFSSSIQFNGAPVPV